MKRLASVRADHAQSREEARADIMSVIIEALAHPGEASVRADSILEHSGFSQEDIWSAFESVDDLLVAIAEHEAFLISQPLVRRGRPVSLEDARDTLVAFGLVAWREYSTTLVGFVRMMMAEGARSPPLKERAYETGLETVTRRLREFLSEANERGVLSIPDAQVCAEQLLGLLREPLYQALMLNPVTSEQGTAADRVRANIDRFLNGCASARSAGDERVT